MGLFLLGGISLSEEIPSFYREPDSYGTRRDPDPPRYVRAGAELFPEAGQFLNGIDLGLDYRFRYEYRRNDLRRNQLGLDQPLLHRTRLYFGVRNRLDPFRFALELTDSRRFNSDYPLDHRDWNQMELTQLYGGLFFPSVFGREVEFRYGRMNFEFLDRRLLANNQWRNTPNTFDGFRGRVGKERDRWQLDLLAVQPNLRLLQAKDEPVEGQRIYGLIGHWRGWPDGVTLEPYYLMLHQKNTEPTATQPQAQESRQVHSWALRTYGVIPGTSWDYDVDGVYQYGLQKNGREQTFATGLTSELGYSFRHAWKPRLSAFYGYASGDRDPTDRSNQRFERFYGFGRPWSASDYIVWENVRTPKLRLEIQPGDRVRLDMGHGFYWLASARDRATNFRSTGGSLETAAQDGSGGSGDFLGQEFDVRSRHQLNSHTELTVGYSHFFTGEFSSAVGKRDSDFLYFELVLNAFGTK